MNQVVVTIVVALIAASVGWISGINGILANRETMKRDAHAALAEDQRTAADLAKTAMELVDRLTAQVKEIRLASEAEAAALRERIRILEGRVSELEAENDRLKIRLYDSAKAKPPTRTRSQSTNKGDTS